jgi:hypothetical protein
MGGLKLTISWEVDYSDRIVSSSGRHRRQRPWCWPPAVAVAHPITMRGSRRSTTSIWVSTLLGHCKQNDSCWCSHFFTLLCKVTRMHPIALMAPVFSSPSGALMNDSEISGLADESFTETWLDVGICCRNGEQITPRFGLAWSSHAAQRVRCI